MRKKGDIVDIKASEHHPNDVLDFWFPNDGFWEDRDRFGAWIHHRMQGGVDDHICTHFVGLTHAAAQGVLDHWAETPRGRLALLLALDQFPRSLWRNKPAAFAQDIKANLLVLEGIGNGHFAAIKPWEKLFYAIVLGHCEGPDHLQRFDLLEKISEELIAELPEALTYSAELIRGQNQRVREIIERFGRHPHRNPIYGRISSPAEEAYIATGDFPHVAKNQPS